MHLKLNKMIFYFFYLVVESVFHFQEIFTIFFSNQADYNYLSYLFVITAGHLRQICNKNRREVEYTEENRHACCRRLK